MLSRPDFLYKNVIILMTKNKEHLSFRNDNVIIRNAENEIILQNSCYRIFTIWIVGPFTITSGLVHRAKKFGFSILFFTFGFRYVGAINAKTEGNVLLRKKQYSYTKLEIGKYLVSQKINNQLYLLKSIRKKSTNLSQSINGINRILRTEIHNTTNTEQLMGFEGIVSKVYFSEWFRDMGWHSRKPRTKQDYINVLLDIGYTMLFNYMDSMLNLYGFDTYCGLYHRFYYQRKSLVCDLVEPFRCIIDKQIKKSHNLGQIKIDDFGQVKRKYILSYKKSKPYTKILMQSLLDRKEDIFVFVNHFYRAFINNKPIDDYPKFHIIKT